MADLTVAKIKEAAAILDRMDAAARHQQIIDVFVRAFTDGNRPIFEQHTIEPEPVKAKTFDKWLQSTSELLEDCAKRGQ